MCLAASLKAISTFSLVLADVSNMKARSLSLINFSASLIDTFRLHRSIFTPSIYLFVLLSMRTPYQDCNFQLLPCTNIPVLKTMND